VQTLFLGFPNPQAGGDHHVKLGDEIAFARAELNSLG
jgi:hypothetical protein